MRWVVTHELRKAIPVVAPVDAYPSLGVTLEYNVSGSLTRVRHELETPLGVESADVMWLSVQQLATLLEIIEFFYGFPPEIVERRVDAVESVGDAPASVGFVTANFDAEIERQVRLPVEQVLGGASPRLAALLHLFNAARPPTSHAEAVRLYFLVWEDLHGSPSNFGAVLPEQRLKYTRDFVSHGRALDRNRDAITFIESEIGESLRAFDPTDPDHVAFVARQRGEARSLIEVELKNQL